MSAVAASCRCLARPRDARGLSEPSHTSKLGRCGDAAVACRGCSRDCVISGRNSSVVVLFALQDLRRANFFVQDRISKGFPLETRIVKFEIGPSENASLSDRSSSTSAAPGRRWCLRGPRGARGLSDTSYRPKLGRCGDAAAVCRGCSRECVISARNSSVVVLFAVQGLRRAIFSGIRFT